MGEHTKIGWCDHTFNPWIGCTKVGPGCDHCYAEALDKRMRYGGQEHWGAGVPRMHTSFATWKEPLRWNARAMRGERPQRVFCASLADVFDNEVPDAWRNDLWFLIQRCSHLDWLIVTKRIGNVAKMVPEEWVTRGFPASVRLLITVCNQEEADRDIPKLLALRSRNGISYEPALGPVDFARWLSPKGHVNWGDNKNPSLEERRAVVAIAKAAYYQMGSRLVEWVICGGESTQGAGKARPFDREWAYNTIRQCKAADVPCFIKQLGSNVLARNDANGYDVFALKFLDRAGANSAEWPQDLRVQEFPA